MKWAIAALLVGYVLPPYSVLNRLARTRNEVGLVGLRIDGTAQVPQALALELANSLGVTPGQGELQLSMAVSIRFPARCRVELSSLDSTKALAAVSSNGKRRSEGGDNAALQVVADEICALLALHASDEDSREALEKHLGTLKVDTRYSSLGRFVGSLVYVVGAKGGPQLSVYKDSAMQPARIAFTDAAGTAWDVRFIDYTSQSTGEWFPRLVEVWKGDQLQLRLTTLNADGKPKLDDKLF